MNVFVNKSKTNLNSRIQIYEMFTEMEKTNEYQTFTFKYFLFSVIFSYNQNNAQR